MKLICFLVAFVLPAWLTIRIGEGFDLPLWPWALLLCSMQLLAQVSAVRWYREVRK